MSMGLVESAKSLTLPCSAKAVVVVVVALGLALANPLAESARPPEAETATRPRWMVIAPHPDDETLIGSGVLLRAMQSGEPVSVVIMTNGDLACLHDGFIRQSESIRGLDALGVRERQVYFLGYPDGGLAELGDEPLTRHRIIDGKCTPGSITYGARGFGRADYHTVRFGSPAAYTHDEVITDLRSLLAELRPSDVITTHPSDIHPDHAATYALFRTAIDRLPHAPRAHLALVHNNDCWPTGQQNREPCPPAQMSVADPTPALTGRLNGYLAHERLAVPLSCMQPTRAGNPKLRAIASHISQTRGDPGSYLFSFARSDEMFFPESYVPRPAGGWHKSSYAPVAETVTANMRLRPGMRRERALMRDRSGRYRLDVDAANQEASLQRVSKEGRRTELQVWPLPHDLWHNDKEERFELEISSVPGDQITEVTLRVRDYLVGVAVDTQTRMSTTTGRIVNASPSARPER